MSAHSQIIQRAKYFIQLPDAPPELRGDYLTLLFDEIKPGDDKKGYVPYYHFKIFRENENEAGHINFKVGETDHVLYCAGNIGFEIKEEFRGNSLSFYACTALAPFVKTIYNSVLITSNPGNVASIRIIEKLGCEYIDEIMIAKHEQAYLNGERKKRRYRWNLKK